MLIMGLNGGLDPVHHHRPFLFPPDRCHDSAAVLIGEGRIVAGLEEERANRIKHTNKAPIQAIRVCAEEGGIALEDTDAITVPYSESGLDGLLRRQLLRRPKERVRGARQLVHEMLEESLRCSIDERKIVFVPHHMAHAASAYYCSGFNDSLVVALDGAGDELSGAVYSVEGGVWSELRRFSIPQSLGLYYWQITEYLGFSLFDEYKVMGLAPYGDGRRYEGLFRKTYSLCSGGDYGIADNAIDLLCEAGPPRHRGEPLTQHYKDIAAALQAALEDIVFHVMRHYRQETHHKRLCLAGGVAHNCTLNGKILYSGSFNNVFVQPAAHDAGLALGGALFVYYSERQKKGYGYSPPPRLEHVYLGRDIGSNEEVQKGLVAWRDFIEFERETNITGRAAQLLAEGSIIGWVQGRSEFGPRALGNRSILADPRPPENKDIINRMVKKREGFRPFAPAVLEEYARDYFDIPTDRAQFGFMIFVLKVREAAQKLLGATTHVDGTARVQTVSRDTNTRFWELIDAFRKITEIPVLLNTSFNNNAEPIVDSVNDAIVCFLTTDLHYLVVGDYLIEKKKVEREQFLQLIPSLPAYCVLRNSTQLHSSGETYRAFEICRNYDDRLNTTISTDVYRVLEVADGGESLDALLDKCELVDAVVEEVKALWSQRCIVLKPRQQA